MIIILIVLAIRGAIESPIVSIVLGMVDHFGTNPRIISQHQTEQRGVGAERQICER